MSSTSSTGPSATSLVDGLEGLNGVARLLEAVLHRLLLRGVAHLHQRLTVGKAEASASRLREVRDAAPGCAARAPRSPTSASGSGCHSLDHLDRGVDELIVEAVVDDTCRALTSSPQPGVAVDATARGPPRAAARPGSSPLCRRGPPGHRLRGSIGAVGAAQEATRLADERPRRRRSGANGAGAVRAAAARLGVGSSSSRRRNSIRQSSVSA